MARRVEASLLPDVRWAVRVPRAPPCSCPRHGMSIRHVAADFAADARQRRRTVGTTALPSGPSGKRDERSRGPGRNLN